MNSTIIDVLTRRAGDEPDRNALTFLGTDGGIEASWTYGELDQRARIVSGALRAQGYRDKQVLLSELSPASFVEAFFGCLYAGVIAVPCPATRSARASAALASIAEACTAAAIIAETSEMLVPGLQTLSLSELRGAGAYLNFEDRAAGLAYLQFTSGSTNAPKGVRISHANIVANCAAIQTGMRVKPDDVSVSWLPLHHDMGLVGLLLQPVYTGHPAVLLRPKTFLQRPLAWLEAISEFGATGTSAPNFAYDHCVSALDRFTPSSLDLSSLRRAICGAEPVRETTLSRFADAFAPYGFDPKAFMPAYGLAEATVLVSLHQAFDRIAPRTVAVSTKALQGMQWEPRPPGSDGVTTFVSCGTPPERISIEIVDPATLHRLQEGSVGEIWVRGESVSDGYWAETSSDNFGVPTTDRKDEKGYLRTGDLGVLDGGELFVIGRLKDLIIVRGRNISPLDVELIVESANPAICRNGAAAVGLYCDGSESLLIFAEVERSALRTIDADAIAREIREHVTRALEVPIADVVLLARGSLPRTTSGKVRRQPSLAAYQTGKLRSINRDDRSSRVDIRPADDAVSNSVLGWLASRLKVGVETLDPSLSLPAVGVDSLMAHEFQLYLADRFQTNLSFAELLAIPSIEELWTLVRRGERNAAPKITPSYATSGPATMGQQALWLINQTPSAQAYHLSAAIEFTNAIDVSRLRDALDKLLQAHPALRTSFRPSPGALQQQIIEDARASFETHSCSVDNMQAEIDRFVTRPFDLGDEIPCRFSVFFIDDGRTVFVPVFHHIAIDAPSIERLLDDLSELLADSEHKIQEVPWTTVDAGLQEQAYLRSATANDHRSYWQINLAERAAVLELPRAEAERQAGRAILRHFNLGAALSKAVRALARSQRVTVFNVLLAAYQAVLHRWSSEEVIHVGVPVLGRPSAEFEAVVGYFANPVVLRSTFDPDKAFNDFLLESATSARLSFAHRHFPFPAVATLAERGTSLARSSLFQAAFVMHASGGLTATSSLALGQADQPLRLGIIEGRTLAVMPALPQFDLVLRATDREEIGFSVECDPAIYGDDTLAQFEERFLRILEHVVAHPEVQLGDLSDIQPDRVAECHTAWSSGPQVPQVPDLAGVLRRAACEHAADPAVVFGEQTLTYSELWEMASSMSASLVTHHDIGPSSLVGVAMHRSEMLAVTLVAATIVGLTIVPLDLAYPRDYLKRILEDANPRLIISDDDDALYGLCPPERIVSPVDLFSVRGNEVLQRPVSVDTPLYRIYTSGSTGSPKGVEFTYGAMANLVSWHVADLGECKSIGQFASINFDASYHEMFAGLACGATVHIFSDDLRHNPQRLLVYVTQSRIERLILPVGVLRAFAERSVQPEREFAAVRQIITTGEQLVLSDSELRLFQTCLWMDLINHYGPSETHVVTSYRYPADRDLWRRYAPLGRPISNTSIYLVDTTLRPVPPGSPGEICIGGCMVGLGYSGRPGLTAEKFVPDPFAVDPGRRMYRTGDYGRHLANGDLEFIGRRDDMVKVRGVRVELTSIEEVILDIPGTVEAAALVQNGPRGSQLVAFVRQEPNANLTSAALREALAARLPRQVVPDRIAFLSSFPKTLSGKIDRQQLAAMKTEEPTIARLPPANEGEAAIVEIWKKCLGVDEVGVEDNFFDIGGTSLLLGTMIDQIERELGVRLSVNDLFRLPTVRHLAQAVRSSATANPGSGDMSSLARIQAERTAAARRLKMTQRMRSTRNGS